MNKLICLSAVIILASLSTLRGEVLVYQFRVTTKNTGRGAEYNSSSRGYMVWDLNSNHFYWLSYASGDGAKIYQQVDGSPLVVKLSGFYGRTVTTFSAAGGSEGRYFQDFNRGDDVTLKHRTDGTVHCPRTFKGVSRNINTVGRPRLSENVHLAVFSPQRSIAANDAGLTAQAVVGELVGELEAAGYANIQTVSIAPYTGGVSEVILGGSPAPPRPPSPVTPGDAPPTPVLPPLPP